MPLEQHSLDSEGRLNPGGIQGGSGEQYFIGRFDGARFINDNPANLSLWSDYGKDYYCAPTFNNLPPTHAHVMLGRMNNWQYAGKVPTKPWRVQMALPRELALKTFPGGLRLVQKTVPALTAQRGKLETALATRSFEIHSALHMNQAKQAGWKLAAKDGTYTLIDYDAEHQQVFVDRTHLNTFSKDFPAAPLPTLQGGKLNFDILVDRSSIEVFAAGGRVTIWPLKSIWEGN